MKQLSISILMGLLCIATWVIAAPVLAQKEAKVEKKKLK